MNQNIPSSSDPKFSPTKSTDEARQGVTGHNVRYVLLIGLVTVVVLFAAAYFAAI